MPAASAPVSSLQFLVTVSSEWGLGRAHGAHPIPSHASREALWAFILLGWLPLIVWDQDEPFWGNLVGEWASLGVGCHQVGRWCVVTEMSLHPVD